MARILKLLVMSWVRIGESAEYIVLYIESKSRAVVVPQRYVCVLISHLWDGIFEIPLLRLI